jgi:hypothetical protein
MKARPSHVILMAELGEINAEQITDRELQKARFVCDPDGVIT